MDYSFPLPPLPEQRKIAAILSAVDDAIARTEAVIEQVKLVLMAAIERLLARGLPGQHSEWRHVAQIGSIPACWAIVRLGSIADVQTGMAKNARAVRRNPVTVPYLRVANVQDGYIDLSELKTIEIDVDELPRYELRQGDVLFTEGGDADKLGRGTVWTAPVHPCVHQNHVFAVRSDRPRLLPAYLALYARSAAGKRYFLNASKQTTNLASINSSQLRSLPIPLPQLKEQQAIVDMASALEARLITEGDCLAQLRSAKQATMDALLTGRLRVNGKSGPMGRGRRLCRGPIERC